MQAQVYKQQLTDNTDNTMYFPLKQITLIKLYVKQHKSEAVKNFYRLKQKGTYCITYDICTYILQTFLYLTMF